MDKPTEEERLGFVESYGVEPVTDINTDLTFKDAAKTIAEFTPIIGDAMAAKEVYDELMKDEPNYGLIAALGGAALVGAVPGIGDAAAAGIRKAVDVAKRVEVDPDAVGMMGGNVRLKPKEQVDFDAKMAALDEAEDATTWQQNAKKVVKERGIDLDDKKSPEALELQESTRLLLENKITRDQHLETVDRVKPVSEYDQLPREPSDKALVFALDSGKREKGVFVLNDETASKLGANTSSLKVGDQFNSRLDIPAYLAHDTWIVAGTSPAVKTADGKGVTTYAKAVHFGGDDKPVRFIASQKQSEKIGTGVDNKTGYATVSGTVKDLDADAIRAKAAELLNDPEWTQVGFDPRRQGGFYVRAGENKHVPVREATEVIQIGPLVLAKNAKLDLEYEGYSEGGMAMEEQMAMNFGDVPDNTVGQDPVSGNDIPLGSTAENVRDDIPAMLSEGEIVIPADVVNYHGVKLFEDLRDEAKLGYAEMAEDGRIGGEPIEDDMEMDNDIGLDFADLEIMEVPDDAEPVEMRRGGMNFERGRGNIYKSYSAPKPTPRVVKSAPPAYKTRSVGSLKDSSPRSYTPAQLGITKIQAPTTSGPERPTLTSKPATSDTANIGNSIAQQIGMYDKDFREKPVEQKSSAERLADIRKRNAAASSSGLRRGVTKARDFVGGLFDFGDEQEKEGPQRVQITGDADYGFLGSPLERANRKGLGPKFDEGGLATDDNLIGGEDQFNQPFYAEDQKGGFDMDMAYPDQVGSGTGEPMLEMREYMNDQGHRIFITFIDGEPQMEIPAGYYPVGEATTMQPVGSTGVIPTVNYGSANYGASQNDDPGVEDMVMPEGINYKELSLAELQEMVEDQKSFGSKVFGSLSPVTRLIMWDQTRRTKAELKRRRDDPYTSEVDKRRYDTLLELANRDEPGLVATLLNKITGKEPDVPQARTPEQTDALYNQLDKMTKAYTPDAQTANDRTTPGVDTDRGFTPGVDSAIGPAKPAATTTPAIPEQSTDADAFDKMQDRFDIERIEADMKAQPRPAPKTATTPIAQASPRVQQARKGTQEVLQNMRDRGASRAERTQALKAGARTENVLRDLDRGVVRGFEKGGLVEEPVVKEVVKGLKKASKTHAKQAGQLEKALKTSKKKKKSK